MGKGKRTNSHMSNSQVRHMYVHTYLAPKPKEDTYIKPIPKPTGTGGKLQTHVKTLFCALCYSLCVIEQSQLICLGMCSSVGRACLQKSCELDSLASEMTALGGVCCVAFHCL